MEIKSTILIFNKNNAIKINEDTYIITRFIVSLRHNHIYSITDTALLINHITIYYVY